ncbi:hypothetical protein LCGC14_1291110 [marine sediment metagenome]|uniref:Uncharacterized protein n=1 Tax=marine sediment metagenome TaxID=412755 RepID=A0A0F9LDA1_9ZZZZ
MNIQTGSTVSAGSESVSELAREFQSTARKLGRRLGRRVVIASPERHLKNICSVIVSTDTKKGYSEKKEATVYTKSATSEIGEIRTRANKKKGLGESQEEVTFRDLEALEDGFQAFGTEAGWKAYDAYGDEARAIDENNRLGRDAAEGNKVEKLLVRIGKLDATELAELMKGLDQAADRQE